LRFSLHEFGAVIGPEKSDPADSYNTASFRLPILDWVEMRRFWYSGRRCFFGFLASRETIDWLCASVKGIIMRIFRGVEAYSRKERLRTQMSELRIEGGQACP